jgi:hypothetical protein
MRKVILITLGLIALVILVLAGAAVNKNKASELGRKRFGSITT